MFPGYSRQFYRPNQQAISRALEKNRKNELAVEDILDEEDLVNDLKSQSFSQLISCINKEKLKKLIDYISNEPKNENDHKLGYKFPYFASEILSSENVFIIDKFFEEEEEPSRRKNDFIDSDEISSKLRKSSIIEINMGDDNTTSNDNEQKATSNLPSNTLEQSTESSKDSKLLNFFSGDDKDEYSDQKTTENNDNNTLLNIVPDINENLKRENMENKENNDNQEENKNINEISQSKSSVEEEKRKVYHNLDYLLNFLSNKGPLNFVLCGYFHKVFNHLLNYKNACLMRYLMETRPDVIYNMIDHLDRKSISECLFKVLISYVPEFSDHDVKKEALMRIFKTFNSDIVERSSCVSDLLTDVLGNRRIYYLIIKNEELLLNLHQLVINNISNHRVNRDLIKILIKFNENLLKDINGIATNSSSTNNSDSQYIFSNYLLNNLAHADDETSLIKSHSNDNLDICNFIYVFMTISKTVEAVARDFVDDSDESYLLNTYNQNKHMFGLRRLVEFEYIYNIVEIIVNANSNNSLSQTKNIIILTDQLISCNIFKKMIEYFFHFPLNNMYQKIFNEMMMLLANKYTPEIFLKEIFVKENFLNLLIDYMLNVENQIDFGQGRTINSGIFAIICELIVFLSESENQFIKQIYRENDRIKEFLQSFTLPIKEKFTKGIQFAQENPFQKQISMEKAYDSNTSSEPYRILIEKCTEDLSFVKKMRKNSLDENSSKNAFDDGNEIKDDKIYYDNNYWNMKPLDSALDEIN